MINQEMIQNAMHCMKMSAEMAVCEDCNLYPCDHTDVSDLARVALEALEKQIPQRPDLEGDGYWDGELVYDTGYCPRCHQDYEIEYHTPKFCENCGQALDWEEQIYV